MVGDNVDVVDDGNNRTKMTELTFTKHVNGKYIVGDVFEHTLAAWHVCAKPHSKKSPATKERALLVHSYGLAAHMWTLGACTLIRCVVN